MSHRLGTVTFVAEHDYEVSCECGAQWRVRLEYDEDAMATCLACGADTFELVKANGTRWPGLGG
jgi:predicted nucleic acid-binding Zn ribbon protein